MNKELIEKLKIKYYVRAFGLMLPEEQECFKKVGIKNCIIYGGMCGKQGAEWRDTTAELQGDFTYAIKPDYQPEPEFQDVEIIQQGNWLGITRPWAEDYSRFPSDFNNLHCLPSLPNFEGFYMPDPVAKDGHEYLFIGTVARNIAKGKTVYARFRK